MVLLLELSEMAYRIGTRMTAAERWKRDADSGFQVNSWFTHLKEWEVLFSDGVEFLSEEEFAQLKEMMRGK